VIVDDEDSEIKPTGGSAVTHSANGASVGAG